MGIGERKKGERDNDSAEDEEEDDDDADLVPAPGWAPGEADSIQKQRKRDERRDKRELGTDFQDQARTTVCTVSCRANLV